MSLKYLAPNFGPVDKRDQKMFHFPSLTAFRNDLAWCASSWRIRGVISKQGVDHVCFVTRPQCSD